jgi:hypothetical protein
MSPFFWPMLAVSIVVFATAGLPLFTIYPRVRQRVVTAAVILLIAAAVAFTGASRHATLAAAGWEPIAGGLLMQEEATR